MNKALSHALLLSASAFLVACGGGGGGGAGAGAGAGTGVTGPSTFVAVTTPHQTRGQYMSKDLSGITYMTKDDGATTGILTTASSAIVNKNGTLYNGNATQTLGGSGILTVSPIYSNVYNKTTTVAGVRTEDEMQVNDTLTNPGGPSITMNNAKLALHTKKTYYNNILGGVSFGMSHYGNQTVMMPTAGQATYTGVFMGIEDSNANTLAITGTSNTTVNFGTGAVNGTVTGIKDGSTQAARDFTLVKTGTVSGSNFKGTTSFGGNGVTTSGGLTGGFYGTQAAEIAGASTTKGTVNGTSRNVIGYFGAAR